MTNPYEGLPSKSFWRSGVAEVDPRSIPDLFQPKFAISKTDLVATAGSCFAQHVGRALRKRRFNYFDVEPAPRFLPASEHEKYGYSVYSARYGNVYTTKQLLQLLKRSLGLFDPIDSVWERDGRLYDAFRPALEEGGFTTKDELLALRKDHLERVKLMFMKLDIFVFTLGLTEVWVSRLDEAAYPTCPGTIAGQFADDKYVFRNLSVREVADDLEQFLGLLRALNPKAKVLLTVSPVPLTATASGEHVLVATMRSKAILRAAAGELVERYSFVDYFPSFELVFGIQSKGQFFESNLRSVKTDAVESVMRHFFLAHGFEHGGDQESSKSKPKSERSEQQEEDLGEAVACEEAILEEFNRT